MPLPVGANLASLTASFKSSRKTSTFGRVKRYPHKSSFSSFAWASTHGNPIKEEEKGMGDGKRTHSNGDMHCGGTTNRVQMPSLLSHQIPNLPHIHIGILGCKRNNGSGWVTKNIQLRNLGLDSLRYGFGCRNNCPARFQITTRRNE